MKTVLIFLLTLLIFTTANSETISFDDAYNAAFSGDVIKTLEIINSFDDEDLTEEQIAAKRLFHKRFNSSEKIYF